MEKKKVNRQRHAGVSRRYLTLALTKKATIVREGRRELEKPLYRIDGLWGAFGKKRESSGKREKGECAYMMLQMRSDV